MPEDQETPEKPTGELEALAGKRLLSVAKQIKDLVDTRIKPTSSVYTTNIGESRVVVFNNGIYISDDNPSFRIGGHDDDFLKRRFALEYGERVNINGIKEDLGWAEVNSPFSFDFDRFLVDRVTNEVFQEYQQKMRERFNLPSDPNAPVNEKDLSSYGVATTCKTSYFIDEDGGLIKALSIPFAMSDPEGRRILYPKRGSIEHRIKIVKGEITPEDYELLGSALNNLLNKVSLQSTEHPET